MDCSEVKDILSSFNDREATPEEKAGIEEHLRACKDCAFESTMIVGLKRLLGHWDGVRASQEFHAKLMGRVKGVPKPGLLGHVNWRPVWIGAAACAGVAVVVLVLWLVVPSSGGVAEEGGEAGRAVAAPGRAVGTTAASARPGAGEGVPVSVAKGPRPGRGEPVAHVLVQEGTLRIRRAGGAESLGSAGDVLAPGDSVRIPGKGHADLALSGGLRLRLSPASAGGVAGTGSDAEFVMGEGPSEGELRSGVSMLAGAAEARAGEAYSVKTVPALVSFEKRDLLAQMSLAADGSLEVAVARGRAEVMLPEGVRPLEAGQAMGVAPDGQLVSPPGPAGKGVLERLWRWEKR